MLAFVATIFTVSKEVAALSSIILAGSGEMLLGEKKRGEILMWSDGLLSSLYIGLSWYSSAKEKSARLYAIRYADANPLQKSNNYYRAIEEYTTSEEYNEAIAREARRKFPHDPEKQRKYLKENGYYGEDSWAWETSEMQKFYSELRYSAKSAYQKAKTILGVVMLTKFVSVLDCLIFIETPVKIKTGYNHEKFYIDFSYNF